MRSIAVGLCVSLVVGCSKGGRDQLPPAPADPAAFAKLSPMDKCKGVAPRAKRCITEMVIEEAREAGGPARDTNERLIRELRAGGAPSDKDAADAAETLCVTNHLHADAVVACWSTVGCAAFAECVTAKSKL